MSKMNLLVHLTAFLDSTDTNNPALSHFKWNRDVQGLTISEPTSKSITLQPGQSSTLFSGTVSTSEDITTTWDLALAPSSSNRYRITHNAGTAPAFRTSRAEGHDATTAITITKNAKLLTYTSTAGTPLNLIVGGAVVGDEVRIGTAFNVANRGTYKILALTATSLTVENELGQAEGPIVLGATFADQIDVYSAAGVQIGDKVDVIAGFSSVVFATYEILDVSHDFIEFFSGESLPVETGVSNNPAALLIYQEAKQFLYIESNKKIDIKLNGVTTNEIIPMTAGTTKKPGFFMSSASIKSAEVTNKSQDLTTIVYMTAE